MGRSRLRGFITGSVLLGCVAAFAQDGQAPQPACQSDARYRQFDFWLGEWDVFVDGRRSGENTISREEGGCLVLERWTDVAGGTGQSYNFFNPATGQWRQVWVSDFMTIDYSGGLNAGGAMELRGRITYFGTERSFDFLGRWTALDDGTVEQYFEQYDPDRKEMVPIFTGIYRRKS